jgi:predicted extracellular nuclease
LIFSEYVEGSGSPTFTKALEIFNPTGEAVDLATCKIAMYQNGSATVTANIALDGFQLQPGAVFVLCHTTITSAANCNQKDSNLTFNGNDAVELNCSNQTVDMVGTAGDVVGAAWGDLTVATEDMTLRRQCSVTSGHKSPTDAFDTAEWQPFPKDDVSGLGVRSCPDTP